MGAPGDKHRRGACSWVGRETRLHVRGLIFRRDGSGARSRKKQRNGKGRKNEMHSAKGEMADCGGL